MYGKQYEYYMKVIKTTTGEIKKFIITGSTITNETPNILEVISKLYILLTKKGLNPLEWTILKIEKINREANNQYLEDYNNDIDENIITTAIVNDVINAKKLKIKNLTNRGYIIKLEYFDDDNSLALTLNSEHTYYTRTGFTINVNVYDKECYDVTNILINRVLNGNEFNKIFVFNKLLFNKPVYIKQSISQDEILISIVDEISEDDDTIEIKPQQCKEVLNQNKI